VVKVARHPLRPYTLDYIPRIFSEFDELHGDRRFRRRQGHRRRYRASRRQGR
jgi:acetyl-CoA carboxylase alpha subunit